MTIESRRDVLARWSYRMWDGSEMEYAYNHYIFEESFINEVTENVADGMPGPLVIMRALGRRDDHGNPIYEHDVLHHRGRNQNLEWSTFEVVRYDPRVTGYWPFVMLADPDTEIVSCRKVGDIHTNPDLVRMHDLWEADDIFTVRMSGQRRTLWRFKELK